jgi:hypothetical protein
MGVAHQLSNVFGNIVAIVASIIILTALLFWFQWLFMAASDMTLLVVFFLSAVGFGLFGVAALFLRLGSEGDV